MRPSWKWMSFLPAIGWAILLSSCANLPNGRGWGQDATISPGWARIGASARAALLSTQTWLPAAGALALQIDNADQRLANWGARHTPVFGSRNGAERGSDDLRAATRYAHLVTVLVTPSGEEPGEAALAKSKGLAVGAAAVFSADRLTTGLKQSTNRERPDDSDDQSFPSGHTSHAATNAALASRNLESIPMPQPARIASKFGLMLLSAGTGWSRVEANRHFPSDALASMALGNFMATFFSDAFLGLSSERGRTITVKRDGDVVLLELNWSR